jgi:hypothetical protein
MTLNQIFNDCKEVEYLIIHEIGDLGRGNAKTVISNLPLLSVL